ncbi:Polyisoprenoid-binding protein YceI [Mucilaginibacter mallensis]|uniref:Polyisoprenoid-binding protein YceI n=1 Tax=Mucilaginibacter mallensis TaxID=652787 RepID=A0A1H2AP66_MUCMA|nr:YceI family protein [Mucilaginibacter mallensis]SDT47815.1 Polyisoprenoid-binding protein YceI [Mucilaginibacter mallensis]
MKKIIILLAFVTMQTALFAQGTWKLDKMHSSLKFTVTHLSVSDVDGNFKDFDVTITTTKADFSDAKFNLTANVASINTDNDMRDADLKSDKFFNAAVNPTLTFVSTGITKTKPNHYKLTGNLTMHGVTKAVTMDLWYRGTIVNPMSKANDAGFQLTGIVKRTDFNLAASYPDAMISDEITIKADGEFGAAK